MLLFLEIYEETVWSTMTTKQEERRKQLGQERRGPRAQMQGVALERNPERICHLQHAAALMCVLYVYFLFHSVKRDFMRLTVLHTMACDKMIR